MVKEKERIANAGANEEEVIVLLAIRKNRDWLPPLVLPFAFVLLHFFVFSSVLFSLLPLHLVPLFSVH